MTEEQAPDEGNLTSRVLGGVTWSVGLRVLGLVAQLGYTSVIARLLDPEAIGLVASAQVVLLAGQLAAELGIGRALVQKTTLSQQEVRAGFTASVVMGATLTAILFLAAPAVAALFGDPGVAPVTRGLSFVLLATTLGTTAEALLLRDMRIRAVATREFTSFVVGYLVIGVGSALAGFGVWSLVAAAVSKAVLLSASALLIARHDMRPLLAWAPVRSLYAFGSQVSLVSVVEYLTQAAPPTAISRFQGPAQLGQFNQANRVLELPFTNISQAIADVLFPAISRIKSERDRVGGAYLTALAVTGSILLPTAAGAGVAAEEIVAVLLGDQWGPAARVLPVLAVYSAVMMLTYYAAIICEAMGVLKQKIVIQVLTLIILGVGFVVFSDASLLALSVVMLVAAVGRLLAYWVVMHRQLRIGALAQPAALAGPVLGAVLVAGAIGGWTVVGRGMDLPVLLTLLGQIVVGATVLGAAYFFGPLRGVRRELVVRLEFAGLDERSGTARRLMAVMRSGLGG